jgi:hypothetical protein
MLKVMGGISATNDPYSVAANVYAMREVPFSVRDLIGPIAVSAMPPCLPAALPAEREQQLFPSNLSELTVGSHAG